MMVCGKCGAIMLLGGCPNQCWDEPAPAVAMTDDDLVEGLAERLYEIEYPSYSSAASEDSNRWSWRGESNAVLKRTCREQARVAVAYINEHTGEDKA